MKKAFIQKRIREQLEYIDVVLRSNRTDERKKEIVESAAGVLKYFNEQNALIAKTIIELEKDRLQWSLKTFPDATPLSSMLKGIEEAKEIISDIKDGKRTPEEYADYFMCGLDSEGRQGIFIEEIFEAFAKKLQINKNRTWIKNPDNTYSHVKQK